MDPDKERELTCEYGRKTGNSGSGLYFEKKIACDPDSAPRDITAKPGSRKKVEEVEDTTTSNTSVHDDKSSHDYGSLGKTRKTDTTTTTTKKEKDKDKEKEYTKKEEKKKEKNTGGIYDNVSSNDTYGSSNMDHAYDNTGRSGLTSSINTSSNTTGNNASNRDTSHAYVNKDKDTSHAYVSSDTTRNTSSNRNPISSGNNYDRTSNVVITHQNELPILEQDPLYREPPEHNINRTEHNVNRTEHNVNRTEPQYQYQHQHQHEHQQQQQSQPKFQPQSQFQSQPQPQLQPQSQHQHQHQEYQTTNKDNNPAGKKVVHGEGVMYSFTTEQQQPANEDQRKSNSGIGAVHTSGNNT